jgi:hypothetical protein
VLALSVALLGVTGCGGSASAPSASAPTDPAAAPAAGGTATPVSTGGGTGGDNIAKDIAAEHDAAVAALRVWGKRANAVCRNARKRDRSTISRLRGMIPKGRKFSRGEQERFGREFLKFARTGEATYAKLREIAMPKEAEAVDKIQSFFDKVEEELMLAQRFGIEVEEYRSLPDMLAAIQRSRRLDDDFKRDARAVKAPGCITPDKTS